MQFNLESWLVDEIQMFTVTKLCNWLGNREDITEDIITIVETNCLNGKTFADLSDDDLTELLSLLAIEKQYKELLQAWNHNLNLTM